MNGGHRDRASPVMAGWVVLINRRHFERAFQKNYADDRVAPRHWQDVNYALARNLIDVTNSKGMPAEA